ncbi:hypothetical protein B0H13DRAFT_244966 [Mycena leptocephala]|nr:hypothetical protein B0H13DRAFT_244966 [Mycena leptocephala]
MEDQLSKHPEYVTAIKNIKAGDIEDKSKGDTLSKGLALLQGLWFMAQCLARICQHIPMTELEVATLAFQFLNILIWLLWWHKPLDVQRPILIGPGNEFVSDTTGRPWWRVLFTTGDAVVLGQFFDFKPALSTSVPSFWSTHDVSNARLFLFILALVSSAFGAIHCAAWNGPFPSAVEMWMWRSCSLAVAAIPLVLILISISAWKFHGTLPGWPRDWLIVWAILTIINSIYISARLVLVALSFTTLRALPPGAFVDVSWSMFIPYFGL